MIPAPGEPGGDSWGDVPFEKRTHVGAWLVPSFDPKLNLVYVGTSVSSPAPKYLLGGNDHEHLYHNSTLALDVETGKIVWYYQHVVDHWDMDHTFERMLLDTAVAPDPSEVIWRNPRLKSGEVRQVLTGIPGKTGIVYTLDRRTGEFLWARPTVEQNIVQSIDGAGRVTVNPETTFAKMGDRSVVCPVTGGRNWPAGTYSPLTRTMYFPLLNACAAVTAVTDKQTVSNGNQSDLYGINIRSQFAPGKDKLGSIQGISVESGKRTWTYEQRAGTLSLVSTAGGLLFGGDSAGYFRAFDQKTGRILWEINLGSPVTGYPISFAVNGRQFVAASTGASITGGGNVLTPDVRPSAGNTIFVFALPE
jgi:alcohol dehydrogenase (cytochrome c)